jgi:hypothetical protein
VIERGRPKTIRNRVGTVVCLGSLVIASAFVAAGSAGATSPPLTLTRLQAMMNTLGGAGGSFDQLLPSLIEHPVASVLSQDVRPLDRAIKGFIAKLTSSKVTASEHKDVQALRRAAGQLASDLSRTAGLKGNSLYRWLGRFINDNETFNKEAALVYRDVAPTSTNLGEHIAEYQNALLAISRDASQVGVASLEVGSSKSSPTTKEIEQILSGYRQLHADAEAALNLPTLSPPSLQAEWSSALGDFASGAESSLNALLTQNNSLLETGEQQLQAGGHALLALFQSLGIPLGSQA